jgi:hypothetical protein
LDFDLGKDSVNAFDESVVTHCCKLILRALSFIEFAEHFPLCLKRATAFVVLFQWAPPFRVVLSARIASSRSNRIIRPTLIFSGMIPSWHQLRTHWADTPMKRANVAGLSSVCAGFVVVVLDNALCITGAIPPFFAASACGIEFD